VSSDEKRVAKTGKGFRNSKLVPRYSPFPIRAALEIDLVSRQAIVVIKGHGWAVI